MWGYLIIGCWFVGLGALFYVETKHGGAEAAGRVSIFVMVLVGFGAVLLADWIVIPVALIAMALCFVPKSDETVREEREAAERADLELERKMRRDELRQAKEDRELGLISQEEYEELVQQITAPPT